MFPPRSSTSSETSSCTWRAGRRAACSRAASLAAYRAIDPALVDARSGVGSGDAFLAGYVACRYKNRPPEDCLRFAVACGAESVQHFGAGVLDSGGVDRLLPRVEIEELPAPAVKAGR